MIGAWVWLCIHVQNSTRGIGDVGTQAGIVSFVTLIRGAGPPESIVPGLERFAGIGAWWSRWQTVARCAFPGFASRW
jgi:hypothetical protein